MEGWRGKSFQAFCQSFPSGTHVIQGYLIQLGLRCEICWLELLAPEKGHDGSKVSFLELAAIAMELPDAEHRWRWGIISANSP